MDQRIGKQDLQAVIRRAAELYAAETDANELLSEAEVLRIGEELGLPARLVRQALYELPEAGSGRRWVDRLYGPAVAGASRAVDGDAATTFARLKEYLTTREYLRPRRTHGETAWFEPADDPISAMARALWRPARRYHLARASRVVLTVRPLGTGTSHVHVMLDLQAQRRSAFLGSIVGGSLLGATIGTGLSLATLATIATLALPLTPAGLLAAGAAGVAGLSATVAGITAGTTRGFRRRIERANIEVEGLLDRLEHGNRLEPPPAPWWRRLQARPLHRSR